ncbi:MAG: hypothetical protein WA667_10585 [Candidatus Nitrosopolaris sp.]
MKVDTLLDAFRNVPSMFLNAAFALRNPIENIHKYPHFFEQPRGLSLVISEIAVHKRESSSAIAVQELGVVYMLLYT